MQQKYFIFSLEQGVASNQPFKEKSKASIDKTGDRQFSFFFKFWISLEE